MIRTTILFIAMILFFVLTIPLQIVLFILRALGMKDAVSRFSLNFVRPMFRAILFITGTHVDVRGMDNIPKDQSVLFVGNHTSYFDIIVNYAFFQRPTGFVAKQELGRVPSLSTWMMLVNCLFLDRKDMKKGLQTILQAVEQVKNGISMFIFPEGTRNRTTDERQLLRFHDGALKIAEKSGCPIVPVAMTGNSYIFEQHIPFITKTNVILEFGKPIDVASLPREEKRKLGERVRTDMLAMLEQHHQEREASLDA